MAGDDSQYFAQKSHVIPEKKKNRASVYYSHYCPFKKMISIEVTLSFYISRSVFLGNIHFGLMFTCIIQLIIQTETTNTKCLPHNWRTRKSEIIGIYLIIKTKRFNWDSAQTHIVIEMLKFLGFIIRRDPEKTIEPLVQQHIEMDMRHIENGKKNLGG